MGQCGQVTACQRICWWCKPQLRFKASAWPSLNWQKVTCLLQGTLSVTVACIRFCLYNLTLPDGIPENHRSLHTISAQKETCDKLPELCCNFLVKSKGIWHTNWMCSVASAVSQMVLTYPKHGHNTFILGTNTRSWWSSALSMDPKMKHKGPYSPWLTKHHPGWFRGIPTMDWF